MEKQNQFTDWLLGWGKFPFFQDMPVVAMPVMEDREGDTEDSNSHPTEGAEDDKTRATLLF